MSGSGLQDLFNVIYAHNSVDKILTGHAYSRAVRAHILAHLALAHVILELIDFTEEDRHAMVRILMDVDRSVILTAGENDSYKIIAEKFREELLKLENNGPTAKLWVQYFRMVSLMKQFIEAERTGNWKLHLDTIQKMLPYFHASSNFFYAKCCHLYLQDMLSLEKFTKDGYFILRRFSKFWAEFWFDMTIEQTLMRTMKSIGGLTHGRGVSDSVLTMWTFGMVYLYNVCDEIENFCGICIETTDQHVDMKSARTLCDSADPKKCLIGSLNTVLFQKVMN